MLIYRDLVEEHQGRTLLCTLARELETGPGRVAAAFFRAADLECALADAEVESAATAADLTDALADAVLGDSAGYARALALLPHVSTPERLTVRRPEGYAFYGVAPEGFVALARVHAARARRSVVVVGIRTIGTSLSSVVRAEVARAGVPVRRFTVRPTDHPWSRRVEWTPAERDLVARERDQADFVVVDEGPGLSGSTFLAVAEGLVELGVLPQRIVLFGTRPALPEGMIATDAAKRFSVFDYRGVASWTAPPGSVDVSAGAWRRHAYRFEHEFPPCFTSIERAKYLVGNRLFKFSGFAPYDEAVRARADALWRGGFGLPVEGGPAGFLAQPWVPGRRPRVSADRAAALPVLARYLAFRARAFACRPRAVTPLEPMVRTNVFEALGVELPVGFELDVRSPVDVDGRLLPHEWVIGDNGAWVKTDAVEHSDDHLYPGPVDPAWDLAGAAVEWDLDEGACAALVGLYTKQSGDAALPRLPEYRVAYGAFRVGVAFYARKSSAGAEGARWSAAEAYYRARLLRDLTTLFEGRRRPNIRQRSSATCSTPSHGPAYKRRSRRTRARRR